MADDTSDNEKIIKRLESPIKKATASQRAFEKMAARNRRFEKTASSQIFKEMSSAQRVFGKFSACSGMLKEMSSAQRVLGKATVSSQIFKDISATQRSFSKWAEASLQNVPETFIQDVKSSLHTLSSSAFGSEIDKFQVNQDGSLSLGSEHLTSEEVSTIGSEVISDVQNTNFKYSLPEKTSTISEKLEAAFIGYLLTQFLTFILSIISPYIATLYHDFVEYAQPQILASEPKTKSDALAAAKKIQYDDIESLKLLKIRIVTAKKPLRLRKGASTQSEIIHKLPLGTLVNVIQKKRNWTKVEVWVEGVDLTLQGWVNTKYIKPIKWQK